MYVCVSKMFIDIKKTCLIKAIESVRSSKMFCEEESLKGGRERSPVHGSSTKEVIRALLGLGTLI